MPFGAPIDLDIIGFGSTGWGGALMVATGVTVALSCAGFAMGLALGAAIACARLSGLRGLEWSATLYTTIIRGVPELLVLYLLFFGGSALISGAAGALFGDGFTSAPAFLTGMLALGLISAAYVAETFRGAWSGIDPGQMEAAKALGMRPMLALAKVIAPQILRLALPGLGNIWQLTLKESALVSLAGLTELMRQSAIAANATSRPFLFYAAAAGLYLGVTSASAVFIRWVEQATQRGYGAAM